MTALYVIFAFILIVIVSEMAKRAARNSRVAKHNKIMEKISAQYTRVKKIRERFDGDSDRQMECDLISENINEQIVRLNSIVGINSDNHFGAIIPADWCVYDNEYGECVVRDTVIDELEKDDGEDAPEPAEIEDTLAYPDLDTIAVHDASLQGDNIRV